MANVINFLYPWSLRPHYHRAGCSWSRPSYPVGKLVGLTMTDRLAILPWGLVTRRMQSHIGVVLRPNRVNFGAAASLAPN